MIKFEKMKRLFRRFGKNDDGNIALTFAVSAIAVIGCMGAAMDFSTLSNAEARSQAIADQTALAAAVFVKTNGREPTPPPPVGDGETPEPEEGYLDDSYRTYTAAELGYDFKGWVDGGADNVTVSIDYDGTAKEAIVTVSGQTVPTFMQVLGRQNMGFTAQATAKYEDFEFYDPASILMVLDNSGSMSFDDKALVSSPYGTWTDNYGNKWLPHEDAQSRIGALKSHASGFMTDLQALVGDQTNDSNKVLRTGMLAYNHATITARTVPMAWQTADTQDSIDDMVATGGTNSAPPLDTARIWMGGEDTEHTDMHGDDPIKFVVFMTDGVNATDSVTWIQEDGTGQWKGYQRVCWWFWCWTEEDTVEQTNEPDWGWDWEEGRWDSTYNVQSVADCDAMKADGVKIYTIGFALASGTYDANGYWGTGSTDTINEDVRSKAYSFLSRCSSEPATFLTAENAEQLDDAFTRIGNDIMTEIIRLSN